MSYSVVRYHDFSAGHRVVGHEGKCELLHGHNYRVHFHVMSRPKHLEPHVGTEYLDGVGRVVDFSVIKLVLCQWLESTWDHKMLIWADDPILREIIGPAIATLFGKSVVVVPFNPTAENMAEYLVETVGPRVLPDNLILHKVIVEETRKCSATYEI